MVDVLGEMWYTYGTIYDSGNREGYYDLAYDNPFRYRGYMWDEETHLYYLRSRYYDPELGRFINCDQLIIACSSFTYCRNNPVIYADITGNLYALVLNVWVGTGNGTGHYSLSIINSGEEGFNAPEEFNVSDDEIQISYGGREGKQGYVTISSKPTDVDRRYLLGYINLDQCKMLFNDLYWLLNVSDGNGHKYTVSDVNYENYSQMNIHYCGSFIAYLLSRLLFVEEIETLNPNIYHLLGWMQQELLFANDDKYEKKYKSKETPLRFLDLFFKRY